MLSDAKIKRAPIKERAYQLTDERGLYIIINADGSKWWRLRYTLAGRRNILSLGVYPDTSLATAREKCDAARKLIAQGIDPVQQRKADKAAIADAGADQFEAVARAWLAKKAHDWVPAHLAKETLRMEKHAFPWIGNRPIRSLGVTDLLPLVVRVFNSGHLEQAYRLCDQLSRVFVYAVAVGRADSDPAHTLAAVLPARRKKKGFPSVVKPDEVGELLRAMQGHKGTFVVRCALEIAPYLFCRPGELRMAEWGHLHNLDGDHPEYHVPPANRKLRRHDKEAPDAEPHIIPLPTQVVAILKDLQSLTGRRCHVFPGARDPKRCMSEAAVNAALATIGYKGKMVGHGFRHMAKTRLQELGFHRDLVEAQLSHKIPGVEGDYWREQYKRALPERRRMMQAWADYLDGLRAGPQPMPIAA